LGRRGRFGGRLPFHLAFHPQGKPPQR
jgi:hypothetical protein